MERRRGTKLFSRLFQREKCDLDAFLTTRSLTDINIPDASSRISQILQGSMIRLFKYLLDRKRSTFLYFLMGSIYLRSATFISTVAEGEIRMEMKFATAQKALQKHMNLAFDVLMFR